MTKCTKIIILTVCLLVVGFSAVLMLDESEKIPVPPPLTPADAITKEGVTVEYLGDQPPPVSTSSASEKLITAEQFYQLVTENNTPYVPADTSDWKTYRNEEYGFEMKYPSTETIKFQKAESDEGDTVEIGNFFYLVITKSNVIERLSMVTPREDSVRVNFGILDLVSVYTPVKNQQISLLLEKDDNLYSFESVPGLRFEDMEIFIAIINSFKFTD
ncbi:MAG: hypothetical protein RLZZ230_138 [Candidatus Parcubacteria bacterium]|jgi:hypothetical protein